MKVKLFKSFGSGSAKLLEVRFEYPEKLTGACAMLGLHYNKQNGTDWW